MSNARVQLAEEQINKVRALLESAAVVKLDDSNIRRYDIERSSYSTMTTLSLNLGDGTSLMLHLTEKVSA